MLPFRLVFLFFRKHLVTIKPTNLQKIFGNPTFKQTKTKKNHRQYHRYPSPYGNSNFPSHHFAPKKREIYPQPPSSQLCSAKSSSFFFRKGVPKWPPESSSPHQHSHQPAKLRSALPGWSYITLRKSSFFNAASR